VNSPLFEQLHKEGLISSFSLEKVRIASGSRLFSINWELKTILYLGILLMISGLGILIYKNIDTIGHQAVLAAIGLLCAGCFFYCERKKLPFSTNKVPPPNAFFDYILLLGCLTFITFITYLQVEYTAFGNAFGLAIFLPMIVLFFSAYYFDHAGILCMAITNLAAWMGIAVTPLTILKANHFADTQIIFAAIALGILLIIVALVSERKNIKAHFVFIYTNFGMNILYIACLAGMFHFDKVYLLWLIPLAGASFYFYKKALTQSSFYFILMISVYGYIAITYIIMRLLMNNSMDEYISGLLYFIASGIFMIRFLIKMNKKIKHDISI
jgi:hypothetical protein